MSAYSVAVRLEGKKHSLSRAWVQKTAEFVFKKQKLKKAAVSIYITTDKVISAYHGRHLDDPTPTDVISYWLDKNSPERKSGVLGDLIISHQTARRVAMEMNITYLEEVARYITHGILHLLGYEDHTKAKYKKMHARQEQIIKSMRFL